MEISASRWIYILTVCTLGVLNPVSGLKAGGRRGKQMIVTDKPVAGAAAATGEGAKKRQRQDTGPTIGLLDPDIMARLASNADAIRNLNRYSESAALSRLQNSAYVPVGFAAQTSSINRPTGINKKPVEHMLIQPVYTEKIAASGIADSEGREYRQDFAKGYLYLPGVGDAVGGYMLGRILIKRLENTTRAFGGCCSDCYCTESNDNITAPWYFNAYIPYRYRYNYMVAIANNMTEQRAAEEAQAALTSKSSLANDNSYAPTDICVLQRLNRELPFSELPNMVLTFLANDGISGDNLTSKVEFFKTILDRAVQAFMVQDKSTDSIFKVYDEHDELSTCDPDAPSESTTTRSTAPTTLQTTTKKPDPWYKRALMQWTNFVDIGDRSICGVVGIEKPLECDYDSKSIENQDPFQTAIYRLNKLYIPTSQKDERMIQELVKSATACYHLRAKSDVYGVVEHGIPSSAMISCLDYSIGSGQARNLSRPASIFANEEICQRFLTPDLDKCAAEAESFGCTEKDIVNLNVFARNFYLCIEPVDQSTVLRISNRKRAVRQDANTRSISCSSTVLGVKCGASTMAPWTVLWTAVGFAFFAISSMA